VRIVALALKLGQVTISVVTQPDRRWLLTTASRTLVSSEDLGEVEFCEEAPPSEELLLMGRAGALPGDGIMPTDMAILGETLE
jgi:hypothetical protein